MQKLKSQQLSKLSTSSLKILSQNRITTILDFLQEDVSKLSTLTKLSLSEILAIRNEIFTKYSAPLLNGTTLYEKLFKTSSRITTNIERLDTLTNGGIPVRYITEICGLADSGKTQLAFQVAINCVKYYKTTVLYVDTKGDFSAIRIQKILEEQKCSHKDMAAIMYKIQIVRVWTMEDLVELFKNIKNKSLVFDNLALIIVDSLPCLMFQHLGDDNKIGLSLLNTMVNYSRYICNEFNVGMIYINIQTRWIDSDITDIEDDGESTSAFKEAAYIEKRNRCLGRYWEQIPALVLLLEKLEEVSTENECSKQLRVSVLSSNSVKTGDNTCILNLSSVGIT
uniref:RecA family profile 1 domain-containing protein n=1 Tax=Heliothis virescens TaxID=7102 RepID=A0A2A4J5G7_HELVI